MTTNEDLTELISILKQLEGNKNPLVIGQNLDSRFNGKLKEIFTQWTLNRPISSDEKSFLDLYSRLQLEFVEYSFLNFNPTENNENLIQIFRKNFFHVRQIEILKTTIIFLNEEENFIDNDDVMFLFLMRLIDARALICRLCYNDLDPKPHDLNDELVVLLEHRQTKTFLYQITSINDRTTTSFKDLFTFRHQFFLGSTTFAVAMFEKNKEILNNDRHKKFIYLLVKSVRLILKEKHFETNSPAISSLRGILALLTNGVPTENWIDIINDALANDDDDEKQRKNPFNQDLFHSLVKRILASKSLRDQAIESKSCPVTMLVDITLIFLNKWADTGIDLHDDEDENCRSSSSIPTELNQIHLLLRREETAHVILPYIDAKYDRLRLMTLATLSYLMNFQDFQELQKKKTHVPEELVKLIFNFLDQTVQQPTHQYKGISFDRLLRYLYRFLNQDAIKRQTLVYLPKLIEFARGLHLDAMKILRRISSSNEIQTDLLQNRQLKEFLDNEARIIFDANPTMMKILQQIHQNLSTNEINGQSSVRPVLPEDETYQVFISYCHRDREECEKLCKTLDETKLFTKIWIDRNEMAADMVETVTRAIGSSQVVLVLLSDAYCSSDFCRGEWCFARKKKVQIYPVLVQEGFRADFCDWANFYLLDNKYYRVHKAGELAGLIRDIRSDKEKRKTTIPALPMTNDLTDFSVSSIDRNYQKKSVARWTSDDIQQWCIDKKLSKWRQPLADYHGVALLELRKILENNSHLQYFLNVEGLNVFDLALFKCELDKIAPTKPVRKKFLKR